MDQEDTIHLDEETGSRSREQLDVALHVIQARPSPSLTLDYPGTILPS